MIRAIQGYNTNFYGVKNIKPQKVARNIVNTKNELPKGLTSSIRREDALDELGRALEKRFDDITNKPSSPQYTTMMFSLLGGITYSLDAADVCSLS